MSGESIGLLIGMTAGLLLLLLAWRRLEASERSAAGDSAPPGEPCWTERISTDGRLSYGRYGCYHSDLAEADARARAVEFNAYG